jgi:putative transposase
MHGNALRAKPEDVQKQHEREIKALQEAYGEAMLELRARKKCGLCWARKSHDEGLQQGLKEEGFTVSISKLCQWFNVPRRTVYYRLRKAPSRLNPAFIEPINAMIEEEPSLGYRTVASLLDFNKNVVQRIFQLKGWQVRKRPVGFRSRIESLPSVATRPDERWATDLCRIWGGLDSWLTLAIVIDCHTWELLGWHLSRSGKASTAGAALEQALIARFGSLGKVISPFLLRSNKWPGLYQPGLYAHGSELWTETGVYHPALPAAEWNSRAPDQDLREQRVHRHRSKASKTQCTSLETGSAFTTIGDPIRRLA